jgi:hypothetical protein
MREPRTADEQRARRDLGGGGGTSRWRRRVGRGGRVVEHADREDGSYGDLDDRRAERRELGRHDGALGVVARAHRWLRRRIGLVIRTMTMRWIGAAARLDDRDRAELRHRHGERDDERDQDGRDPGRGAPDEHAVIRAPSRRPCQRRPITGITVQAGLVRHCARIPPWAIRGVDYDADSRIRPPRTIERRNRRNLM